MGHENVADVAVFGVDDEKFGQRLKAVIVKKGVARARRTSRTTSRRTSRATRSPRDVVFIDELPRTSTGKVAQAGAQEGTSPEVRT